MSARVRKNSWDDINPFGPGSVGDCISVSSFLHDDSIMIKGSESGIVIKNVMDAVDYLACYKGRVETMQLLTSHYGLAPTTSVGILVKPTDALQKSMIVAEVLKLKLVKMQDKGTNRKKRNFKCVTQQKDGRGDEEMPCQKKKK